MNKKKKRKICIITGTRAEYGLLKPLMGKIKKSKDFSLQIIATGMHLSPAFGLSYKEIEKDGFKINAKIKITPNNDTLSAMAKSIGQGIIGITNALNKIKPDIVIILGDRSEALSATISAIYMNIIVAHIHGGDSAQGGIDEYARHAISKLAHIHFPATKKSAKRLIKMGENPWRVHIVGAPGLDSILKEKLIPPTKIAKKYKLNLSKPILLVIQHPITTETENAGQQMKETMEAIKKFRYQTIIIYPNSDAGSRKMIKIIKKYTKYPYIKTYKNLPHIDYLSLMKIADVMIGNSSSGIIESPSFHLPVVNIGSRQKGRECAKNLINVPHKKNAIQKAIQKALFDKKFKRQVLRCTNPYGKGKASDKIIKILRKVKIDKKLLQKKITY